MNSEFALKKVANIMISDDPTDYHVGYEIEMNPFYFSCRYFDGGTEDFSSYEKAFNFCLDAIEDNSKVAFEIQKSSLIEDALMDGPTDEMLDCPHFRDKLERNPSAFDWAKRAFGNAS